MQNETIIGRETIRIKKPTLYGMIFSPREQFERIKAGPVIWLPLILLSIVSMCVAIFVTLNIDIEYGAVYGLELTDDEISVMKAINLVLATLGGLLGAPISYAIFALILLGISRMIKAEVGYKQLFSLIIYVSFISMIGQVINQFFIMMIDGNPAVYLTSLNGFIRANGVLGGMLGVIEVFSIWYYILLGIGLVKVANISKPVAYTIMVIFFIITLIVAAINGLFQGNI
ncbi:hypothetical protein JOC75_001499 [Metabacillus crassostreae]|uniref:Yip1 family protein n=1 Tax=Metabacillus crassostreae TaxID=929098 RepID=UPI001959FA5C|nr:Yip1 family protein [Metabacillus crassostreae]MBM7603529.1 hypothetical protein [Metabacillus crassostreae]